MIKHSKILEEALAFVKEKCYQSHVMNVLLFLILESVSMIIVLICCKNMTIIFSKSVSDFLFVQVVSYCTAKKTFQEILYMAMLDYLLRCVRLKSGRKLVLGATVVYSCGLDLRTNYFSIISFCLYV